MAYRQIIDAFRLRTEDEYVFNLQHIGVYAREDPTGLFKEFLDLAEKSGVLPVWWTAEKRGEVQRLSQEKAGGSYLHHAIERSDVIEEYGGDTVMPLKLRALGEKVYGRAVHADQGVKGF